MMDPGPSGGGARRGKRRRPNNNQARDGGGRRRRGRGRRRDNRSAKQRTQDKLPPSVGDESSILGGRVIAERTNTAPKKVEGPPDAFGLFCAYFLGVAPDDTYKKPNVEEIARRHSMTPEEIEALLLEFDLEPSVVRGAVDLEGALLDIRVAPAGISRIEICRDFYEEYVESRAK